MRAPIGAYIASKYACVGYSEMLRAELAGEGIGVSVLCPGVVASNLTGTSAENRPGAFGAQAVPHLAAAGAGDASASPPAVQAMAAEDVGPIVIRAIRANRFHVITHHGRGRSSKAVSGRCSKILTSPRPAEWDPSALGLSSILSPCENYTFGRELCQERSALDGSNPR